LIACAPDQAVDVEAAPETHRLLFPENGVLVHTNHFLDPEQLGVIEPPSEKRPHSYHRRTRLLELLEEEGDIGVADMQNFLRDREGFPYSICRDKDDSEPTEEHYITITSVIMDMRTRTMWITDGQPDRSEYEQHTL
jgi:isopenicillin-N N-acyltransferase-like protein